MSSPCREGQEDAYSEAAPVVVVLLYPNIDVALCYCTHAGSGVHYLPVGPEVVLVANLVVAARIGDAVPERYPG